MSPRGAVLYGRVSHDRREGKSVDDQLAELGMLRNGAAYPFLLPAFHKVASSGRITALMAPMFAGLGAGRGNWLMEAIGLLGQVKHAAAETRSAISDPLGSAFHHGAAHVQQHGI
jgi:hypothetical protein